MDTSTTSTTIEWARIRPCRYCGSSSTHWDVDSWACGDCGGRMRNPKKAWRAAAEVPARNRLGEVVFGRRDELPEP